MRKQGRGVGELPGKASQEGALEQRPAGGEGGGLCPQKGLTA